MCAFIPKYYFSYFLAFAWMFVHILGLLVIVWPLICLPWLLTSIHCLSLVYFPIDPYEVSWWCVCLCIYTSLLHQCVSMCYVLSLWGVREAVVISSVSHTNINNAVCLVPREPACCLGLSPDERLILKLVQAAHMICCPSQDFKAYEWNVCVCVYIYNHCGRVL